MILTQGSPSFTRKEDDPSARIILLSCKWGLRINIISNKKLICHPTCLPPKIKRLKERRGGGITHALVMLVKTKRTDTKFAINVLFPSLGLPVCHILVIGVTRPFNVVGRVLVPGSIFQFALSDMGSRTALEVKRNTSAVISASLSALCDVINLMLRAMVKDKGVVYVVKCCLK